MVFAVEMAGFPTISHAKDKDWILVYALILLMLLAISPIVAWHFFRVIKMIKEVT